MPPLQKKIGLLCTIGDWYRHYCDLDLIPLVGEHYKQAKEVIGSMGIVCDPGIVETADQAKRAGEYFRRENVDIILLIQLTWTSEECVIKVWDEVPDTPLVFLMTQGQKGIPDNLDMNIWPRYWSVNGNVQMSSSFVRVRPERAFGHMVGHLEDESIQRKLNAWIGAASVIRDMKDKRSYYLPSNCPKFYGIWANEAELVRKFKLDIQFLPQTLIQDAYEAIDPTELKRETEWFYDSYDVMEPTRDQVETEMKLFLALRKISRDHNLSMLTVQPWPHFVRDSGSFGLAAMSVLVDREGLAVNDEGDMNHAVSSFILQRLSGRPSQMFENLGFDLENNLIFGGHDGFCPPSLAAKGRPKVRNTMYGGLREGNIMAFEFIVKPGPVTILGVGYGKDGYFLRATKGTALESAARSIHMPHTLIHLDRGTVEAYFNNLHDQGGGHHYALVHGDFTLEIEYMGKLLGLPVYQL